MCSIIILIKEGDVISKSNHVILYVTMLFHERYFSQNLSSFKDSLLLIVYLNRYFLYILSLGILKYEYVRK